jgi:hypothetical protein
MSVEYSEIYMGDCTHGSCTRPATVRVHKEQVLCALHFAHFELVEANREAYWRGFPPRAGCPRREGCSRGRGRALRESLEKREILYVNSGILFVSPARTAG